MIIYGTKATELITANTHETCPSCGTTNSVQMTVFQKYAHVFWVPFFPIGKTGMTQCSHCKQVLQKKEFTDNLNARYEVLKDESKMPVWTFSGLAILGALVVWGVIAGNKNDAKNARLILTPQKGDLYEVKKGGSLYTLYKVEMVSGDTVFVLFNKFETNKMTGLTDLKNKGDAAFSPEPEAISKTALKNMLDKGEIMDIDRK